ncbi:MAG: hypothetical protein ACC726_14105 [Chloroflexota bacterium]
MAVHLRDDKFIISCAARTGSTMLQLMLDSHPDIVCHGETIDRGKVGLLVGRYTRIRYRQPESDPVLLERMTKRPESFLYDVLFDSQGHQAVGFKFKTDEALSGQAPWRDYHELIVRDADIKVIRLKRRNLLEQLISHEAVRKTGVTLLRGDATAPAIDAITIEPERAVSYIRDVLDRERRADEAYAEHRQLHVTYEGLVEDGEASQAEILRFIGVDVRPLTVSTKKILNGSPSLVSNLDEVTTALQDSGLADFATPSP